MYPLRYEEDTRRLCSVRNETLRLRLKVIVKSVLLRGEFRGEVANLAR